MPVTLVVLVGVAALATGCGPFGTGASPTTHPGRGRPSPTGEAGGTPRETVELVPSGTPAATAEPGATEPSDDLGPFACNLPITGSGTGERAQIVDVRVGTHDGYDRIVFEFESGIPDYEIEQASPPFFEDPTGRELTVLGDAHVQLRMPGGTKQGEDGSATYTGPTSFHPHFEQLVNLEEAGDFEAQSTWIAGLEQDACVRVLTLTGPDRLVIDLEHP